jgi:F0F1-type ATP synthase assembly protein I
MPSEQRPRRRANKATPAVLLGVGLSVSVEIAVGGYLGYFIGNYLDQRWGTQPWMMLGTLVLFLSSTLFHAFIVLDRVQKRMDSSNDT